MVILEVGMKLRKKLERLSGVKRLEGSDKGRRRHPWDVCVPLGPISRQKPHSDLERNLI